MTGPTIIDIWPCCWLVIIKTILTLIISVFFMCCLIALYVLKSKTSLSQSLWRRVFLNFAFVSGDWRVTSNRVIHWLDLLVTMLDMAPSNQDCLLHVKCCYCEVEVHYKSEKTGKTDGKTGSIFSDPLTRSSNEALSWIWNQVCWTI